MTSNATKATRAASAAGYTNAIVNGTYKFGQQNDTALLESMFPVRTTKGESKITFIDATVSGEVAQLPAGPLNVAFGTDIRREKYEMTSSDNVLRGDLVGIAGLQVKDTMDHYALFAEATIPVVKRVEVSAAVRADKSTNSDVHFSPKLGLRVNATDTLLLRATAAGGFRAPNIVETGNGLGRSSFATDVSDPRRWFRFRTGQELDRGTGLLPYRTQGRNRYPCRGRHSARRSCSASRTAGACR